MTQTSLHRHGRAARRTAGHPRRVGGIAYGAEERTFVGRTHRKFVAVLSADNDRIFVEQALYSGSGKGRLVPVEHPAASLHSVPGMTQHILDTQHQTSQATGFVTSQAGIDLLGPMSGFVGVNFYKGVEVFILFDSGKVLPDQ